MLEEAQSSLALCAPVLGSRLASGPMGKQRHLLLPGAGRGTAVQSAACDPEGTTQTSKGFLGAWLTPGKTLDSQGWRA